MQNVGIIIHHSVCPSINGKGYDFLILKNASIIPAVTPTDLGNIHICLEGDFSSPLEAETLESKEQLFLLAKLILRLSQTLDIKQENVFSHTSDCPGPFFPWSQLVISPKDGYH